MEKIALQAYNQQYVSADLNKGGILVANRNEIKEWETFELIDRGNGQVALKAANGQYLSAEGGGGGSVLANGNEIKEWETFELIDRGNGQVALKAANGQYLSAEGGGGGSVLANGNEIKQWETFSITNILPRQQVWSDEFEVIDESVWSFEVGGEGWGNNELQYYTNGQNAFIEFDPQVDSKVLVIEARQETPPGSSCWYDGDCQYSSTRLISKNKKSFQYGRIEAKIKLPQTQGIWPAFWMLGDNFDRVGWPECGEIDIMEHIGSKPTITSGALHGPGYSGDTPFFGTYDLGVGVDADYHIYAIEWDTNGIRWFVDDTQFYSVTRTQVEQQGTWVFDQPFWLLLNVAVGGTLPGNPDNSSSFPQRMYVDYIRIYQ